MGGSGYQIIADWIKWFSKFDKNPLQMKEHSLGYSSGLTMSVSMATNEIKLFCHVSAAVTKRYISTYKIESDHSSQEWRGFGGPLWMK